MNEKISFKMGVNFAAPFYMVIYYMKLEVKINQIDVR